jgi:ABC-type sugar transport system permease subunit
MTEQALRTRLTRERSDGTVAGGSAKRRSRRRLRESAAAFLFVLPALLLVGYFVYLPLVRSIRYAFTTWNGISAPVGVGLKNFDQLLASSDFRRVILNNVILLLGLIIWVLVPMILAILAIEHRRAALVRVILIVPLFVPPVVVGIVFRILLADDGPINIALRDVGLKTLAVGWLTNPDIVLFSIIMMIAWATLGTGVLLFSAAISAMSTSVVEAAMLDGANWWQLFWHVYRPALRPITRFWRLLLTIATVTSFFPWVYGLTKGGPGYASTTFDYFVYETGVGEGNYGLASAAAVLMLLYLLVVFAAQGLASYLRPVER